MNLPQLPQMVVPKVTEGSSLSKGLGLAAPIGAIAISVLALIFIVWPRFTQVLALRVQNAQLETREASLTTKVQTLSSLDRAQLDQDLGAAEALLPSDKSVFSLVAQIERASSSSGVLVNRLEVVPGSVNDTGTARSAGSVEAGPDLGPKVQIKLAVTSDYKSFLQLTSNILSIARAIAIRDLTLSSSATPGQAAQIRASLTIDAYWQELPKELSSIESPVNDLTDSEKALLAKVSSAGNLGSPQLPAVPTGKSDIFAGF